MSTSNNVELYTVQATADLSAQASRFRAITIAGTLVAANPVAGASGQAIGVLWSSTRSGDQATYAYQGIAKCVAGAAVSTLGYPVMTGSSGYFFAANSGFAHIGRALETAASGDLFQALVDFTQLSLWTGV
jgi:hypothetical protein